MGTTFDIGIVISGERSLPFGLLVKPVNSKQLKQFSMAVEIERKITEFALGEHFS